MKKERLYNLEILRVVAAVFVFLFHTYHNMNCTFGPLNDLIKQSTFWMSLFFVLSGFLLEYNYSEYDFNEKGSYLKYFKKRAVSLFPLFMLVEVFFLIYDKELPVYNDLVTAPLQLSGLFMGVGFYDYLANSGLWFIGCMFLAYLIFPYLKQLISFMNGWVMGFVTVLAMLIVGLAPYVNNLYGIGAYSDTFARLLEFFIGCICGKIYESLMEKSEKNVQNSVDVKSSEIVVKPNGAEKVSRMISAVVRWRFVWIILSAGSIAGIFRLEKYSANVQKGQSYLMGFSICACFLIVLCFAASSSKFLLWLNKTAVVRTLAKYSFEIWISTFFVSIFVMRVVYPHWTQHNTHILRVLLCILVNAIFTVILVWYNKGAKLLLETIDKKYVTKNPGVRWLVYPAIVVCVFAIAILIKLLY